MYITLMKNHWGVQPIRLRIIRILFRVLNYTLFSFYTSYLRFRFFGKIFFVGDILEFIILDFLISYVLFSLLKEFYRSNEFKSKKETAK